MQQVYSEKQSSDIFILQVLQVVNVIHNFKLVAFWNKEA